MDQVAGAAACEPVKPNLNASKVGILFRKSFFRFSFLKLQIILKYFIDFFFRVRKKRKICHPGTIYSLI